MAHCIYTPSLNFGFGIFTQAHIVTCLYISSAFGTSRSSCVPSSWCCRAAAGQATKHLWLSFPGDSDVPVYHPSHLLVPVSIYCPSLHFASGYCLLDSLWGTFAYSRTWILSLLWSSPASVDLVLWDCSCAMMIRASVLSFKPAFFVATGSHFLCQWYILCRGQVVHDVSSLCSSSVFSLGLGDIA